MIATTFPPGPLVDCIRFKLRNGAACTLSIHETHRRGGRRLIVRDEAGKVLADTDDQYDLANATHRLDALLADVDS